MRRSRILVALGVLAAALAATMSSAGSGGVALAAATDNM
jgi:hypothetical protein